MKSAVLIIIFNRPDLTQKVINAIKLVKPNKLYFAADGPRQLNVKDQMLCDQARNIVMSQIDWPCQIQTLFRSSNLGCKNAVSEAISWFFSQESEGIILEDDCLPSYDFFNYCDELLERYRSDNRIGLISGTALLDMKKENILWGDEDYIFNRYPSIWGWASWSRFWENYDVNISKWKDYRNDISALTPNKELRTINNKLFDKVFNGEIDTWDYQLSFTLWSYSQMCITPRFNLIENIGFGENATHTKNTNSLIAKRAKGMSEILEFPLKSPALFMPNYKYQTWIENYFTRSKFRKLIDRFKI